MSWRDDTREGYGNWEAEESRGARQYGGGGGCYRHQYHPNGRGGGVCACGDTLDLDDL